MPGFTFIFASTIILAGVIPSRTLPRGNRQWLPYITSLLEDQEEGGHIYWLDGDDSSAAQNIGTDLLSQLRQEVDVTGKRNLLLDIDGSDVAPLDDSDDTATLLKSLVKRRPLKTTGGGNRPY